MNFVFRDNTLGEAQGNVNYYHNNLSEIQKNIIELIRNNKRNKQICYRILFRYKNKFKNLWSGIIYNFFYFLCWQKLTKIIKLK